jgi:hypothetical protein
MGQTDIFLMCDFSYICRQSKTQSDDENKKRGGAAKRARPFFVVFGSLRPLSLKTTRRTKKKKNARSPIVLFFRFLIGMLEGVSFIPFSFF